VAPAIDQEVKQPLLSARRGLQSRDAGRGGEPLEPSKGCDDGVGGEVGGDEEPLVRGRRRAARIGRALGRRRSIDEQACKSFVKGDRRLGRLRLSHDIGQPERNTSVDARIEVDPRAREMVKSELRLRRETLERLALGARMRAIHFARAFLRTIDVSHAKCPL
jgi:hypothetical protein